MPVHNLPFFGEIDLAKLEEYYEVTIQLNSNEVELDLNFSVENIEAGHLNSLAALLSNLAAIDAGNKAFIEQDYNGAGDTVRMYIDHHLDEIDDEELGNIIDLSNTDVDIKEQLVKALKLIRVGFYPGNEQDFAVFDYSIDPEFTQYLVVLFRNEKGEIHYITMES